MSTVVEPSTIRDEQPAVVGILASELTPNRIVTNLGLVIKVARQGVFVIASIRGTVWSLATGTGDVHDLDVVWHESQTITIDVL